MSTIVGSSPRVRGTERERLRSLGCLRFIPARAGNSPSPRPLRARTPVHPRACGEQPSTHGSVCHAFGSSPRVRGTGGEPGPLDRVERFIPARAGNSASPRPLRARTPVHPRACGEQAASRHSKEQYTGSSPRVRGTVERLFHDLSDHRFIPARAGNRWRAVNFNSNAIGSSPRVRGTVAH